MKMVLLIFLSLIVLIAVAVFISTTVAMGKPPNTFEVALVVQGSTTVTEETGKRIFPTMVTYLDKERWIIFDSPLEEGEVVYFVPYWENSDDLMRGWVKRVEKADERKR